MALPDWAVEIVDGYVSGAVNQFILHGNVADRMLLPDGRVGDLAGCLEQSLLAKFDVIFTYDLGGGLRVEKGKEVVGEWPAFKEAGGNLPTQPRAAVETLTHFFRYQVNLLRMGSKPLHVACIMESAHLVMPNLAGGLSYDLNATAALVRDWSSDPALHELPLATILLTEAVNDLHPLLTTNFRAASIKVPLPGEAEIEALIRSNPKWEPAVSNFSGRLGDLARQLRGVSLASIEGMLKLHTHRNDPIDPADLGAIRKSLVEREGGGLITFIESGKTLDDLHGLEGVKRWVRQDIELWKSGHISTFPMGYLLCGPVGTGKTYFVECLAGEAGVPIVKLNNFRDKYLGTTEGNLEKIFRLLAALGRCYVFIDEADQALGKRDSGASDAGLSGRVYSMFAQEMSNRANRGRIVWILASSRPDLIEVDLKRPGRIDVKLPIFPTTSSEEGFGLIRALCKRHDVAIAEDDLPKLQHPIPELLTPGAADVLASNVHRELRTVPGTTPLQALDAVLERYQPPVDPETIRFQIRLAADEATDRAFVPAAFADGNNTESRNESGN